MCVYNYVYKCSSDPCALMQASVHLSTKLSHSSAAIIDQKPVTADDLDDVLKGLAKFNMENPRLTILCIQGCRVPHSPSFL